MKKHVKLIIYVLIIVIFCILIYFIYNKLKSSNNISMSNSEFTFNIIRNVNNNYNTNYLISPYSIEVALKMLEEGATGETKEQISSLIKTRALDIKNSNVKVANAIFIKDKYKPYIKQSFTNELSSKFSSEILYDQFNTPDVINNWVNDKTNGMINKVINNIPSNFVLGLANAIAIDVKWKYQFECDKTTSEVFYKENKDKINVSMMHASYKGGISYLDGDVKGIMLPYNEDLTFVALLPKISLKSFVDSLNNDEINKLLNNFKEASSSKRVNLSLPKYGYSFDMKDFKNILISMGIKDAFDSSLASFDGIISRSDLSKLGAGNIYVSDAVHKAYIDLNESGTKAAAVTYFGMKDNSISLEEKYDVIDIKFDKPFMYMILDSNNEILFFGSVYEPNLWNGSSCDN